MYEGKGPNNVYFLVFCATDNRNRSTQKVKHVLTKHGGSMGSPGSAAFMFKKEGILEMKCSNKSEEQVFEACLESGVESFAYVDKKDLIRVVTSPEELNSTKKALEAFGLVTVVAELQYSPQSHVQLDEEAEQKLDKILAAFNELDDVIAVVHNAESEVSEGDSGE